MFRNDCQQMIKHNVNQLEETTHMNNFALRQRFALACKRRLAGENAHVN